MDKNIKLFENREVRTLWNAEQEDWYFSVVDVVAVLTDSADPKQYIKKMKNRDPELLVKWGTICTPVEMIGKDGKKRKILAATTQGVLRLVQSIPSPKAEPFKVWLARVGSERLDEIADPEKAIARAVDYYRRKGYSEDWINQRMLSIKIRNTLTDEWNQRGITESKEYAILTNEVMKGWSGLSVKEYKEKKGLKKEGLRDNMTDLELVLTMLAEATTTNLSQQEKPETFAESKDVAKRGGKIAGEARKSVEKGLGRSVVSSANAKDSGLLDTKKGKITTNGDE